MHIQATFISLVFAATSSLAAWQVTTIKDSMTDETRRTAVVVNENGHSLSVYRQPSGTVWANFSLASKSVDQLTLQKPPVFRIDKNEPNDVVDQKRLQAISASGIQAFAWEPKWINFLVWHGEEAHGRSKTLNELMQGTSAVFRYYLFTGGYKETTFSLQGARPAIAEALGIPQVADSAVTVNAEAFKTEFLAATTACQRDMKTLRPCFERVSACHTKANNDSKKFRQCLH